MQQKGATLTVSGADLASATTTVSSTDGLATGSHATVAYAVEDAAGNTVTDTASTVVK